MQIRDAVASDLDSIAGFLLVIHHLRVNSHPKIYREISHETAVDFLAARLSDNNGHLRVAEANSELLGYCSAAIRSDPNIPVFQPREFIYLNEIVIRPVNHRGGDGRALLADLKELARPQGAEEMELEARYFNSDSKDFFKSQRSNCLVKREVHLSANEEPAR